VTLMGRPLADATARFSGIVSGPQTSGEAEIAATLGGAAVKGAAKLSAGADGGRVLQGLRSRLARAGSPAISRSAGTDS